MFRSTSQFDKLLDKATSNLKLEPDWPVILQICDLIRQGDVQPKQALAAIKKKMASSNPHVAMFSLIVLESCVKNCGSLIHDEIGTKASMEQLRETIKTTTHENVKAKLLELIQAWAYAFRNSPKYRAVQDTVNIMKAEGYKFPVLKESDAMFSADTAPGWADGDCCHRCRVQFTLLQRKHHCRACGQVFCAQCTAKTCTLPKFGIEKEVRVCEACYEKVNKPQAANKDDLPLEYLTSSLAQQSQAPPPRKSDAELKEEEELQLAIALSQSEAEQKSKSTRSTPIAATRTKSYSPPPKLSTSPEPDPELARYLNRSYWQQQSAEYSNASAPIMSATSTPPKQTVVPEQNGVEESEMEEFVSNLQSQVEIFVNRMKSNSSRGRSIANDSSVQTLFMNITAMHSKLLRYIQQQDDRRVYFEGLQDKLAQVKDARAALDALREEHREKLRREAEIAERQRQLQMAQKLDIMRKKKQEYLQYQRQLALQRIQEQEREMQIRQEQQKQQYLIESQYATLPYMRTVPPVQLYGHPRGVPMMMDQPRPPMDQPGLMIHGQPGMIPPGMVPQNMIPMGPPGSLPPNMQMMGQHNTGQPQPPLGPPQALQGPASMPGSQPLQNQLPGLTMPQSMSSRPSMGGSQTLPRQSVGVSQVLQGPPSLGGPPPPIQGQPVMGVPQTIPGQPPVSLPQPLQNQQPVSGQPPIGQQPPLNVPQSMQGVPQMLQGPPTMNGPHSMQTQPTMSGPQTTPGMPIGNQPISHPSIPSMPQPSVPQMAPQNIATMMGAHPGQQQTGPSMPQQPFQPPAPPSQPQQEDKTAELISFD